MSHTRNQWTKPNLKREAKKYKPRGKFWKNSRSAYNAATRLGILNEICVHMISLRREWTKAKIKEEAIKHKTRSSFWKASAGAVRAAKKMGIFDEVTSHMEERRKPSGFWTKEKILGSVLDN